MTATAAPIRSAFPQDSRRALLLLGFLTAALFAWSLSTGALELSGRDLLLALLGSGDARACRVLWDLRLPRALGALLAGGGLAVGGLALQGLLRNPLAAPSTLGINSGAALGANLAILLAPAALLSWATPLCAFLAALSFALLVTTLAHRRAFTPEAVVLTGMALNAMALAAIALLQCFAQDTQLSSALFWTFGDLGRITLRQCLPLALVTSAVLAWLLRHQWQCQALEWGDPTAESLGVDTHRLRHHGILLVSLVTATAVSLMGILGFLGLLAPHLAKRLLRGSRRGLLPAAFLAGAALLLLADLLCRLPAWGVLLPAGALTSLFGAPLFLALLGLAHPQNGGDRP